MLGWMKCGGNGGGWIAHATPLQKDALYVLFGRNVGEYVMPTVGALEFQRKFGEFQHHAQREPVEITRHGRREFVLMSAEHYDWLTAAARRTHRTIDAMDVVIDAVARAEMDPEHAALDELLK